jgi:hypothetical protein
VHVALVGGSVTWGQGAVHGGSFGRRFFTWLNATWPGTPHRLTNAAKPSITSSLYALCGNDMIPQVGAALAGPPATHAQLQLCPPHSPCMLTTHAYCWLWPQDADIIILEFAFNDNYAGVNLQSPERAAYERVRRAGC